MEPRLQRRVQRYGWDKAAKFYEDSWKDQLKQGQQKLLEMADIKPGEKVLDAACGSGLVTFEVANDISTNGTAGEVVAIDLSGEMISLAESKAKSLGLSNITFERMDAENLDFENETFDVALNSFGLMYIPDPVQSLKEMHRVLKPGGRTVISIWGARKNCGWAEIFPIVDNRVASDVCPLFFQQGTGDTLKKSLEMAGFKNVEVDRFMVDLHYSSQDEAIIAAFAGGPVALAYQKFDTQTKEEAHAEYLNSIEEFRVNGGYSVPGEFVVAKGEK
ncbi:MAG: class I SAM-dependent methyltransferase [Balneolaceae bacterium]